MNPSNVHLDFTGDSIFIDKYVKVKTHSGIFEGFADAIDPISRSVILSKCSDKRNKTTLIIGNSVVNIEVAEPPQNCEHHVVENMETFDQTEVLARKERVRNWLLRNLLPIEESESVLRVHGDCLQIGPPYRPQDCRSNNTIVLGRVQHLLMNIPEEPPR